MANKDQFLLEQLYEKISEPKFVTNRPHPVDPIEGSLDVNRLVQKKADPKEQYIEAAKEILNKILKKDHNINMAVIGRDNFSGSDVYEKTIDELVKCMQEYHDNADVVHNHAKQIVKNMLPEIEKVTNRYNYNPEKETSNATADANANVNSVPMQAAKPHYGESFSTLGYIKNKTDVMSYSNLMEKTQVNTSKAKPNVLNYIK